MTATHAVTPAATPEVRAGGTPADASAPGVTRWVMNVLPGLLVTMAVALVATVLGRFLPIIGAPVFAILVGMALTPLLPALRASALSAGYAEASRTMLQLAIVVLGTGLSLRQVVQVGGGSLPVMLGTLAVALIGAMLVGRWLGVERELRVLIGVGTGICGASAIAAVTSVMRPRSEHVAYALGTIFAFNVAAVLTFPVVGHLLALSGEAFGLWSGTAVNDTSSVVAVAYSFGDGAGPHAIVVKLTRSLMIIPITLFLAWVLARRSRTTSSATTSSATTDGAQGFPWRKVVPLFLVGFVLAAGLNSIGAIPATWHPALLHVGTFLIAVAMAGIGLSIRWVQLRSTGLRPLMLGGILWVSVASASLLLQHVTGTL